MIIVRQKIDKWRVARFARQTGISRKRAERILKPAVLNFAAIENGLPSTEEAAQYNQRILSAISCAD